MNYQLIALASGGMAALLLGAVAWLWVRTSRLERVRREFFSAGLQVSLDEAVVLHSQNLRQINRQIEELGNFLAGLTQANRKNYQKVGFIRFNPFGDAGGAISFALALLDADNSGIVISSLHGREGNRVYAKEVSRGASKSPLTEEEQQAINSAK